jgi:hypothetical protein
MQQVDGPAVSKKALVEKAFNLYCGRELKALVEGAEKHM